MRFSDYVDAIDLARVEAIIGCKAPGVSPKAISPKMGQGKSTFRIDSLMFGWRLPYQIEAGRRMRRYTGTLILNVELEARTDKKAYERLCLLAKAVDMAKLEKSAEWIKSVSWEESRFRQEAGE